MRKILALLALIACPAFGAATAGPVTDETLFLDAREAFQRGDIPKLNERASRISKDYPLRTYVEYWQLRSRLSDASTGQIEDYLSDNKGSLTADRLRADWLRLLARNREWSDF